MTLQRPDTYTAYCHTTVYQQTQEAQLSQRDRATLRVIEDFAKSLKVTWNDTVEYGASPY